MELKGNSEIEIAPVDAQIVVGTGQQFQRRLDRRGEEQPVDRLRQFAEQRMSVRAYEDVSQTAANIAAQQMIAQGVRDNGLGDAGGMLFGMNLASGLNPVNASQAGAMLSGAPGTSAPQDGQPGDQSAPDDFASQLELLEKLKGLMDAGVVTEEEFAAKKRQILGI